MTTRSSDGLAGVQQKKELPTSALGKKIFRHFARHSGKSYWIGLATLEKNT